MKKPVQFPQVGFDLLIIQLTWTLGYLGIMLLVNIVRLLVFNVEIDTFYNQSFFASNIFMLVIGIISINFLRYYVENGITRKNYFLGNVLASIFLSILIPIFSYIISILQGLVLTGFREPNIIPESDGNLIADLLQTILLSPYVDTEANLLLSLANFSLNIFVFYILGWLISTAFYRIGVIGGLLFIAIALGLAAAKDSFQRIALDLPLFEYFSFFHEVPTTIAISLVFAIIVGILILLRLLTKRAPVKM